MLCTMYYIADKVGEWLQVNLVTPTKVTGVITHGGRDFGQWITSYNVAYGNATCSLTTIKNGNGTSMV